MLLAPKPEVEQLEENEACFEIAAALVYIIFFLIVARPHYLHLQYRRPSFYRCQKLEEPHRTHRRVIGLSVINQRSDGTKQENATMELGFIPPRAEDGNYLIR